MRAGRLVLCSLLLVGVACGPLAPPPLGAVATAPPPQSPELRETRNRLDIHYRLNSPATVSSRIVSATGGQWLVHSAAPRPTAGD
jgi:hypothetical protein